MNTKTLLAAAFLCCGIVLPLRAQTQDPYAHIKEYLATPFQIRIEVRFLGEKDDPVMAATINTGLRALQNVVLVKDNPDLVLVLMGKYTGRVYTCSYVVLNPANHTWANFVGAKVSIAMKEQGSKDGSLAAFLVMKNKDVYGEVYKAQDYGILGGGDGPTVMDAVLKSFDSRALEPLRQNDQKTRDEFRDDLKAAKP